MGADMLAMTFYTRDGWHLPENLRELAESLVVSDVAAAEIEGWDEDNVPATREDAVTVMVGQLGLLAQSTLSREVTWNRYGHVKEWLTGGMSWGDQPTEAFELWSQTCEACEAWAPGLIAACGIYFGRFEVPRGEGTAVGLRVHLMRRRQVPVLRQRVPGRRLGPGRVRLGFPAHRVHRVPHDVD